MWRFLHLEKKAVQLSALTLLVVSLITVSQWQLFKAQYSDPSQNNCLENFISGSTVPSDLVCWDGIVQDGVCVSPTCACYSAPGKSCSCPNGYPAGECRGGGVCGCAYCGDKITNGSEQCDGGNLCDIDCQCLTSDLVPDGGNGCKVPDQSSSASSASSCPSSAECSGGSGCTNCSCDFAHIPDGNGGCCEDLDGNGNCCPAGQSIVNGSCQCPTGQELQGLECVALCSDPTPEYCDGTGASAVCCPSGKCAQRDNDGSWYCEMDCPAGGDSNASAVCNDQCNGDDACIAQCVCQCRNGGGGDAEACYSSCMAGGTACNGDADCCRANCIDDLCPVSSDNGGSGGNNGGTNGGGDGGVIGGLGGGDNGGNGDGGDNGDTGDNGSASSSSSEPSTCDECIDACVRGANEGTGEASGTDGGTDGEEDSTGNPFQDCRNACDDYWNDPNTPDNLGCEGGGIDPSRDECRYACMRNCQDNADNEDIQEVGGCMQTCRDEQPELCGGGGGEGGEGGTGDNGDRPPLSSARSSSRQSSFGQSSASSRLSGASQSSGASASSNSSANSDGGDTGDIGDTSENPEGKFCCADNLYCTTFFSECDDKKPYSTLLNCQTACGASSFSSALSANSADSLSSQGTSRIALENYCCVNNTCQIGVIDCVQEFVDMQSCQLACGSGNSSISVASAASDTSSAASLGSTANSNTSNGSSISPLPDGDPNGSSSSRFTSSSSSSTSSSSTRSDGIPTTTSSSAAYSWSSITGNNNCGNGIQDPGEQCELNFNTCRLGIGCNPVDCTCTLPLQPNLCGNGRQDLGEQCELDYNTCARGLACDPDYCQCVIPPLDSNLAPVLISDETSSLPTLVASARICGNGVLEKPEECDDSNRRSNDGCNEQCLLELGICGDGVIQSLLGEQCESSLHDSTLPYLCQNCQFVSLSCGDGVVDPGEECDEGNQNSTSANATCRPDCHAARCGDGILDAGEECDDGNLRTGDGCDRLCEREVKPQTQTQVAGQNIEFGQTYNQYGVPQMNVQQFGFPQVPSTGYLPYQLPLAQLQPLIQGQGPVGDTGPAAIAVIGAGAASGFTYMRRMRKK